MPIGKIVGEKPRIISSQPVITNALRSWQPILPRPLRELWLGWLEDIEVTLRSREFWVGLVATKIATTIYNVIKKPFADRFKKFFDFEFGRSRRR